MKVKKVIGLILIFPFTLFWLGLPTNTLLADASTNQSPLFTFQILSDIHLSNNPAHRSNQQFDAAMQILHQMDPDSSGIMIAGDITDGGNADQWDEYDRIKNKYEHPEIHECIGNHDTWSSLGFNGAVNLFCEHTGTNKVYHDTWINDYHFIFLGSEYPAGNWANLSNTQLKWFEQKISEKADDNKPIFVFLHQPLENTVAGSKTEQKWYGVYQDKEIKAILEKYPQTIFFTGHTHWQFGSKDTMYQEKYCTMFNIPSLSYLWSDSNENVDGSQGYFVEVYKDKVLVKGWDFIKKIWHPSAQFTVTYPVHIGE